MIIEDVKRRPDDDHSEPKSPYYFRSRIVDITTDLGKFSTPMRMITRAEHIARSEFGLSKALPKELAIDFRILIDKQMQDFVDDSKAVKNLIQKTRQFNDITRKSIFRLSVFQPADNVLGSMSTESKIKFADLQADFLQIRLGTHTITYPYLALPVSDYKKFIDSHYVRNENFSTIFVLDMAMDAPSFREIIKHLIDKQEPMIIALIYRDWLDTALQHDVVTSYFDNKQVAFLACQVPREEPDSHGSNLHSVAFGGGFDLVALEQPRGFNPKPKLDLNKIRFFSPQTLYIDSMENTLKQPNRTLFAEFNLAEHNFNDFVHLRHVIDGYRGAEKYPQKFKLLQYLAKIHEAITSPAIFESTRDRISRKEMEQYIIQTSLKDAPLIKNRKPIT